MGDFDVDINWSSKVSNSAPLHDFVSFGMVDLTQKVLLPIRINSILEFLF